jgi:hypothetical protein
VWSFTSTGPPDDTVVLELLLRHSCESVDPKLDPIELSQGNVDFGPTYSSGEELDRAGSCRCSNQLIRWGNGQRSR